MIEIELLFFFATASSNSTIYILSRKIMDVYWLRDLIQFLIINLNATISDHTPNGSNQRSSQPKGPWKHPKPPIYHQNPRLPPENTHLPPKTSLMHQICIHGPYTCGDNDFSIFRALVKALPCGDKLMVTTLLLALPHNRKYHYDKGPNVKSYSVVLCCLAVRALSEG